MGKSDKTSDVEVLARSTSVKDAMEKLKQGTVAWKIRDKGVRGLVIYRRKYRLDLVDLRIHYLPSKAMSGNVCGFGGTGASPSIDLGDIAEVRAGHSTDTFNALNKQTQNNDCKIENLDCSRDRCFSLVFKDDTPPLDLVSEDEVNRNLWVNCLSHLVVTIRSLGQQKEYELYLKKQFKQADKNDNGCLTLEECSNLIEQLNIKMPMKELKSLFKAANFSKAKPREKESLDEKEFVAFYYSLLKRPELDEVFIRFTSNTANDGPRMTAEGFAKFLKEEQKMEMATEECAQLIDAFEPTGDRTTLSIEGFTHFMMFSEWQEITDPSKKLVYQDMNQPLSHYWMASSHNTYLLGNQVTGDSSVDAYVRALKQGCRCVELDCWDGDDGQPIIYHGWTLTSKISFLEVMRDAILPYAFHATDYPLILSIENHCSIEQQDVMADHMLKILGTYLYTYPPAEDKDQMPSPEDLKKKILVKAKRLPPGKSEQDDLEEDEVDETEDLDEKRKEKPPVAKKKSKAKKISQKLSDCVNYIHAVHFPGFENAEKESKYYHMSSFGESKAFNYIDDLETSKNFVKYNTRQISRIYPGAKRQDSSNLKVIPPWNAGCQIVALNYQTDDKHNVINRARFSDNGGCGFVLKPDFLRDSTIRYSPLSPSGLTSKPWEIAITIVSGQHIPKPSGTLEGEVIDPYIKVRLRGHPDDERDADEKVDDVDANKKKKNRGKTEHVSNNGFNPVWKEKFNFVSMVPELAFLEFRVKDYAKSGTDKDIGCFCSPLKMIQEGYRRVPLQDYSGRDLTPASLLVHILIDRPDDEV